MNAFPLSQQHRALCNNSSLAHPVVANPCNCARRHNVTRKQHAPFHDRGVTQQARGPRPLFARQRRDPVIEPAIIIGRGEEREVFDLYEYLLRQRIIFVGDYITDKAAGTKGRRFATKNCRMMMTMPMGGSEGSHFAIERTVQELNALYQLQMCYYNKFTNLSFEEIEDATVRDLFFTPEEAVQIGLVDHIISGPGDFFTPPAIARQMQLEGRIPPYNPGPGSAGLAGWTGRMG